MGILLFFNGVFMLIASLVSLIYKDGVTFEITISSFIVLFIGALLMLFFRHYDKQIQKREGYLIVTLGWLLMAISGTIPYIFTETIPNFTSSFFETMSGYTTTGATILDDIESLPEGILFWRSTTHWIGGMGIIVLAIAILPFLGIGGIQLFTAEAPGPAGDKLHPRITDTAKRLWLIYFLYTFVETFLLYFAGMTFFDAINHAMSTLSTGGFSTKNNSIAYWNDQPIIQYIIISFMFLAGTNFVLSYFIFTKKIKKDSIFTYISAQILGCLLGVMLANFMFDLPFIELSRKARPGFNIFIAEVIATFGLIFIIFGSLKNGTVAVAASVATYITAGYWFTSSTSFANPAVALARTFTDTFTGINYLNTPTYIVAEIIGALLALFIIKKIFLKK